MKYYFNLYFCLFLILQLSRTSLLLAQNLVQNGSFELNTGLPNTSGLWNLASSWSNAHSTTTASPDYLHTSGSGLAQLPNSVFGTVNPFQGNALMGFAIWYSSGPNYREYISQALANPLTIGKSYTLSFQITNGIPGAYGGSGIQNIGVDFSDTTIVQLATTPLGYTPLLSTNTMTYSSTWTQLSFTFTAAAAYTNFVIGNFATDANTVVQTFVPTQNQGAYYFIDDVSLVENAPSQLSVSGDSVLCLGSSTSLTTNSSGGVSWVDSLNTGVVLSTNPIFQVAPTKTTTYFAFGVSDTASYMVQVNSVEVNLGADSVLCDGDSMLLNAFHANASYLWQDSSTNASFLVKEKGKYWVEITLNSCTASDTIEIAFENCAIELEMPNVFTPNADGKNDRFVPIRMNGIETANLMLFNRWGQKMAETTNLKLGWDGKYKQQNCPDGTYFWLLSYTTVLKEAKSAKGFILLEK